jgi:hypothetical protein
MAKRIQMQKNRYINMKKMLDLAKLPNDPGVQVKPSSLARFITRLCSLTDKA